MVTTFLKKVCLECKKHLYSLLLYPLRGSVTQWVARLTGNVSVVG